MIKAKPSVIEYAQKRILTGREKVSIKGEFFHSVKEYKEVVYNEGCLEHDILFCPHCGAGNRATVWGFPMTPNARTVKKHKGQCPNCGERLVLDYADEFDNCRWIIREPGEEECFVFATFVRSSRPTCFPVALKWWEVAEDKLAIETVHELLYSRTMYGKYWIQRELLRYRFVFNLKTGQSYMMRGVDGKNKPSKESVQTRRLQNYAFKYLEGVPSEMRDDFVHVVLQALAQYRGLTYEKPAMDSTYRCAYTSIDLSNLSRLMYFSSMQESDIRDFVNIPVSLFPKNIRAILPRLRELSAQGEVEWLPKYMQKPSVRKRLLQHAANFFFYRWLRDCGVTDINVMNRFVDYWCSLPCLDKTEDDLPFGSNKQRRFPVAYAAGRCLAHSKGDKEFIKWALEGRSAESAYAFLVSALEESSHYLIIDSSRMLHGLKSANMQPARAVGNLKEVHDALAVLDHKRKYGNKEIEYSDVEKALEIDLGEYSFRLAKDTDSLYDIGKTMGICVGSYSNRAAAKACTILTMQKAEKYVACIELRVRNRDVSMAQLKSKYNHTVAEIEPVVEWVQKTGIKASDCYDYRNALERRKGGFDDRDHDYHVENPRLQNPHRHVVVYHNDFANREWRPEDDALLPF